MTDTEIPQVEMEIGEVVRIDETEDTCADEVGSIQSGKPKKERSAKQKAVFEKARQVRAKNLKQRKEDKENIKIRKKEARKKAVEQIDEEEKIRKQPKRKVKKQVVYEDSSSSEEEEPQVVVVRRRKKTKPKRKPKWKLKEIECPSCKIMFMREHPDQVFHSIACKEYARKDIRNIPKVAALSGVVDEKEKQAEADRQLRVARSKAEANKGSRAVEINIYPVIDYKGDTIAEFNSASERRFAQLKIQTEMQRIHEYLNSDSE